MTTTIGRVKGVSGTRLLYLTRPKQSKQIMVTYQNNLGDILTIPLEKACSKKEIQRLESQGDFKNV